MHLNAGGALGAAAAPGGGVQGGADRSGPAGARAPTGTQAPWPLQGPTTASEGVWLEARLQKALQSAALRCCSWLVSGHTGVMLPPTPAAMLLSLAARKQFRPNPASPVVYGCTWSRAKDVWALSMVDVGAKPSAPNPHEALDAVDPCCEGQKSTPDANTMGSPEKKLLRRLREPCAGTRPRRFLFMGP